MNDPSAWIDILLQLGPFFMKGFRWVINWAVNRIKWRGISEEARRIAFALHSYSWTDLQQTAPIINRVGLITRLEIEQIQNIWSTGDFPLTLHGEAGTGKSGIALRLGQSLANNGMPVLFIRATDFPISQEPVAIIQNRIALSISLMDAIAKLGRERSFAIILDQLDSVAGTDLGKNFTGFLKAVAGIPKAKVLAVTRSHELLHDPDISSLGYQTIESGVLTTEQSVEYLARLGLTSPPQLVVDLARNLLNLSLISDVVALTPDLTQAIVNEVELWKQFYITIQQREGDDTAEFVLKLAHEVTRKGERDFSVQFPNAGVRRRLLSRGILVVMPARRFAFRHEQLQDFLCAYSLLPEQPTLRQILDEFGNNISEGTLSWLHLLYHEECPNVEPVFIGDILDVKDKLRFYTRTRVLENLKKQINPNDNTAKALSEHFRDGAYQRFFFEGLENTAWIIPLYKSGFFNQTPDPVEVQSGSFQLPGWPAGEYLVRFADQYEDIVIDVVQSIRTENWRVQEILVDAMMKISPNKAATLVPVIDTWLNGRFSDMLPNKLVLLTDHLAENGMLEAATQILEYVITPVLPPVVREYSKYRSPVRFRADHYWVNEFCEKQSPKLGQKNPAGVVFAFERQLEKAVDLTRQFEAENADLQIGYYWRMDIPNRLSERGDADAVDILVDGLRDGLSEVCKQSIEEGREILTSYLISEHIILRRIAMYILRGYGQNYPDLVNQTLFQREYLENSVFANEYQGLMRDQFTTASQEVRDQVISWILSGPNDVDERAKRRDQWKNREVTDDDRVNVQDDWSRHHLEIIRDFISGEALFRLNELIARYGKPDIEERPHMVTTSWGGAPSPVSSEELVQKSFDDIKNLFLTYVPKDLFLNPRESLAQTFQRLVSDDPTRYTEFAPYLTDPAIRFVYIFHYLSGMREGIKNKKGKLTDEILGLCEYVVDQKEDPFERSSGELEPDLFSAQMGVAQLLEEALRSDDPYLTREQLVRIRSLLISLSHHHDPKINGDGNTSFDPFTHSLNCVRGVVMHGIIHYSLYLIRQYEKQTGQKLKEGFLEPEIVQILEEKLDLSIEPSLAAHSVYGAFVPQLHYLSREWLEQHLTGIFPDSEELDAYWKEAWDAYIFASNVYRDVFKLLIPQYQRGLQLLSKPQDDIKHIGGSPNERLAQHLMFAYLAGLTEFGHENMLIDLFYDNAPDAIRAQGIFWLSQVLGNDKPSPDDVLWEKCWDLWQRRMEIAETQDVSQNTQEMSDYMRWLEHAPVGLDALYPILRSSVKYLHDSFDVRQLIEYAGKNCDQFPTEAVSLLQMSILSAKELWWSPKDEDEE
jgi:hypothetical protein